MSAKVKITKMIRESKNFELNALVSYSKQKNNKFLIRKLLNYYNQEFE